MEMSYQDYRAEIKNIFGTDDLSVIRQIAEGKPKTYHFGRKKQFSEEQAVNMLYMKESGKKVQDIADAYSTSRQTVYQYLDELRNYHQTDSHCNIRMYYMYRNQICTRIDADLIGETVKIKNYTGTTTKKAFGNIENPTWKDFNIFLESRCLPRARANIKEALRDMKVDSYDPIQIISVTHGKMEGDSQWVQIVHGKEKRKEEPTC